MSKLQCDCDVKASLDRIETRVDHLVEQGAENNAILKEHIRRTELLENTVLPLEKEFSKTKIIVYVALALASSAGLLGTFGKTLLGLFTGAP